MQVAMVKPGRTGVQMVYSERDLIWMEKNGWAKAEKPAQAVIAPVEVEVSAKPKGKPGRPKKAS